MPRHEPADDVVHLLQVIPHPDVLRKMGSKQALHQIRCENCINFLEHADSCVDCRDLSVGLDTTVHATASEMEQMLPAQLLREDRVIKQEFGCSGGTLTDWRSQWHAE